MSDPSGDDDGDFFSIYSIYINLAIITVQSFFCFMLRSMDEPDSVDFTHSSIWTVPWWVHLQGGMCKQRNSNRVSQRCCRVLIFDIGLAARIYRAAQRADSWHGMGGYAGYFEHWRALLHAQYNTQYRHNTFVLCVVAPAGT